MAAPNTNYEPPTGNKQQGGQQNEPGLKKRVYVGNLPPDTSREELRELGSKYGRVIQVELIRAKDGRLPFGFISFLSEEDAGYTAYMLHDHVYKNAYPLEVSLSNSKIQPARKPGAPRQAGGTVTQAKNAKPPRVKKTMYSLRELTPKNPPTQTNQDKPNMKNYTQNLNDDQGVGSGSPTLATFTGWTDNPADVPQAPLGRTSNPPVQNNQDFNNNQPRNNKFNNDGQGTNRKNNNYNNNNNRNRGGGAFRRAQDSPQFVGDEVRDDDFDSTEQIPVVVQDSPALNQFPPQNSKRNNQKGQVQGQVQGQGQGQGQQNRTTNPKGGQQKNKLGSNTGGPQTVSASIQYTQAGRIPTSNVQVNVETAPKKISINFNLPVDQIDEFLNAIQPYVQENTQ